MHNLLKIFCLLLLSANNVVYTMERDTDKTEKYASSAIAIIQKMITFEKTIIKLDILPKQSKNDYESMLKSQKQIIKNLKRNPKYIYATLPLTLKGSRWFEVSVQEYNKQDILTDSDLETYRNLVSKMAVLTLETQPVEFSFRNSPLISWDHPWAKFSISM